MKLIVGLGNPEPRYETTRHNAGFLMVDELARKFDIDLQAAKYDGQYGKGSMFSADCFLIKPQTYMNLSGRCVGGFARFYKVAEEDIIVLHDDVDVPAGKVRARKGGGAGGHNGIRSIIKETGMSDFHRIKLGVGKPGPDDVPRDVADWVLAPMRDEELLAIQNEMLEDVLVRLRGMFQASKK